MIKNELKTPKGKNVKLEISPSEMLSVFIKKNCVYSLTADVEDKYNI